MKVLSLFDGMACGMIAMQLAGVEVESYDAYEIDKYAIKTAQHNFPMIKEHGDVFEADFTQYDGVDFLIGGSPCTYWSIAQTKNRETVASGMGWELFSQYVRALHEAKPKYFIYENNKSMSKDIRASIDKAFGFEAVLINSALVSAQNRQRLYWVGKRNEDGTYSKVNVEQPKDRGILLKDVLDCAVSMREKAHTIDANYYKGGNFTSPNKQSGKRLMAAEPVCLRYERTEEAKRCRKAYEAHEIKHGYNELNELHPRPDGKTNTITTVLKDNQIMEPVCVAERGRMYCGQPQHYEARTDGNTNTLTSLEKDNRVSEPINVTEDGKSQTLKAQYCKNSVANFCCYSSTYGASGVAEPINVTADGKAQCLRSTCYKDGIRNIVGNDVDRKTGVAEPVKVADVGNGGQGNRVYSVNGKAVAQTAQSGGLWPNTGLYAVPISAGNNKIILKAIDSLVDRKGFVPGMFNPYNRAEIAGKAPTLSTGSMVTSSCAVLIFETAEGKQIPAYEVHGGYITIKGKQYPIKLKDGFYIIRKLTVRECMRLQTVPEWYEFPVSDSQAYKMLGNGWTCEVIAHILKSLKEA